MDSLAASGLWLLASAVSAASQSVSLALPTKATFCLPGGHRASAGSSYGGRAFCNWGDECSGVLLVNRVDRFVNSWALLLGALR